MTSPERIPVLPFGDKLSRPSPNRGVKVLPLEKKEKKEKKIPEKGPAINSYESYRSRKGILNQEAYARALVRAADPSAEINPRYMGHAKLIAEFSGIELSGETLKLYAILRDDDTKSQETGLHVPGGDRHLLAEVLYREEKYDALKKLVEAYPNIFN